MPARGLPQHLLIWGDLGRISAQEPLLLLVHGWMDVAASFQFMVEALRQQPGWAERPIAALDWRGFGQTPAPAGADSYFFPDYLGDLDAVVHALSPDHPIDLLGHSMGGNVVTMYAGARPSKIRRLVNLEGFGMPATTPDEAPDRYTRWLDELRTPMQLKAYDSLEGVAGRLRANNPRIRSEHALWLAQHWAREEGGRWVINADPAHKRTNPLLYRVEEVKALWARITCPVLFIEGLQTQCFALFGGRYTREEFMTRAEVIADLRIEGLDDAGHMLHHDQPEALAIHLAAHFTRPQTSAA
ncbi:MAG: alpha/beta hydrolase [Burkholderiales bacterium RIFCSPLOWO2_12_FULL_64_99]|nr:MAG: alpha/beta hydrolase [Burkholderiales bacterium RIFCSPHIGHO2_12_FULL_63_20]OGB64227.1 MAG: alpha/beta hydrolase [Burkholderiales bacterium RIFCSPLOWO2_12_FULL_64_99]